MKDRKIRVGLVGGSVDPGRSWGTRAHIPALKHLPAYEITAICTSRDETAKASAEHFDIRHAFSDVREMAGHADVDMIAVSVRGPAHREMVEAAVAAGKPVFCEWPLGVSTAEARSLLAATSRAGVANMIGLQSRGVEALQYARDLIADGYIGKLRSTAVLINHEPYGPEQSEEMAYLGDIRNGVNLLHVGAAHTLSGMDYVLGGFRDLSAVITQEYGQLRIIGTSRILPRTVPDNIVISGTLQCGAVATVRLLDNAKPPLSGTRFEINGTEGDLLLTSSGSANINRALFELRGRRGDRMDVMPVPAKYRLQPPGLTDGDPPTALAHLYNDFAAALREDIPVRLDFNYAVRLHEMLDVIQSAAETGVRQPIMPL